ncbi:AP2/ERF and B3 domain-containing transcription factor At1g50680-like [Diospyros lotus]|uniref:AP2/ERF and B3 domain-containing transcription factor At1g50680-like n=1 Tax=Diospyros lotus TaxID=55363 RepID=UPI00224E3CF0|nr:AP2/ERF and B3 domain-containing transcription factor At1g50680-like [Diospyros lotus]
MEISCLKFWKNGNFLNQRLVLCFNLMTPLFAGLMEEEMSNMVEDAKAIAEASDWRSLGYATTHAGKCPRNDDNRPASTKFKGVVPQPNGHWGAQIYANHQRIWLGTFKTEIDAAMAYDSASMKLRNGDGYRNIPWTNTSIHEPEFQSLYSTETILNMIRNGSYPSKFSNYLKSRWSEHELGLNLTRVHGHAAGFSCRFVFQKELTPSDVGKLNRLVVPKRYAAKYFPPITEENLDGGMVDEVHLFFYDKQMKLWKFRYCFWKSSQSCVFTKGWSNFVKEKGLKANDIISFYTCQGQDEGKERQAFWVIDINYAGWCSRNANAAEGNHQAADMQMDLCSQCDLAKDDEDEQELEDPKVLLHEGLWEEPSGKKRIRLFGVEID